MMATNAVGDIKENAMHQPLLSPDEPLVVVLLQSGADATFQAPTEASANQRSM